MPFIGTLRSWHDDRGFGFIAPTHGGAEVFVHISAFPRDGSRPTQGEQLRYELGRGKNGEVQAVGVTRLAVGAPPSRRRDGRPEPRSRWPLLVASVALGFAAVWGYGRLRPPVAPPATTPWRPRPPHRSPSPRRKLPRPLTVSAVMVASTARK
jgi:cold shock CspA family protein